MRRPKQMLQQFTTHLLTAAAELIDWLSMVLRLHQHSKLIGYTADGFYRSDDPINSVKALHTS